MRRADRLLALDTLKSRELLEHELGALIEEGQLILQSHRGQELIGTPEIFEMEHFLAEVFQLGARPSPHCAVLTLADAPGLNESQGAAVQNALQRSISLITGGAGTGKTFTIRAILDACEIAGLSCSLAAPTGKAAAVWNRLSADRHKRFIACSGMTVADLRKAPETRSMPTF